jgi:hypothetical protein
MVSYEYIAGFFDGEGYIQIAKKSPGGHSRSPYWLACSMANTHRGVLDEIQKITGGQVIFHKGAKTQHSPHYRLTFYTQHALNFLKAVQPYLVIKREEADLAIAFYEHIKESGFRGRGVKLAEAELLIRHDYYLKMKAMKGNRGANTWTLNAS